MQDGCTAGDCTAGAPLDGDDLEECRAASRDPAIGCVREPGDCNVGDRPSSGLPSMTLAALVAMAIRRRVVRARRAA